MNLARSLIRGMRSQQGYWPGQSVTFAGETYPLTAPMPQQSLGFREEDISGSYVSLAELAYKSNPVVFACMEARRRLFSEGRFQWQQIRGGTPGKLFGTEALALLEHPWGPSSTTGDLLSQAIQHADLAGNAFVVRRSRSRLKCLRPDWTTIVAGSRDWPDQGMAAIDAEVIGYAYWPGGKWYAQEPVLLLPEEVAHFAPTPDPTATFRGMSWLTPAIREIVADQAMTTHKRMFMENGATPNLVVSLDPAITPDKFKAWVTLFEQGHEGVLNAYKTLYLGGGADVEAVGANFRQIDFKVTQGAGETRIAADAGVPPIIVGLSEGLQAATYANYASARRAFSDGTVWPLWNDFAGTLESILPPPPSARLAVDGRHIKFLQEDEKDRAETQAQDAQAISTLVTAGYDPPSVVDAIVSGDLERLRHSGLYSVQLQPAGSSQPEAGTPILPSDEAAFLGPGEVRCGSCHRLLAEMATAPYRFTCPKCRHVEVDSGV